MRDAGEKSLAQIQADVGLGALADAGLSREDVDDFFCGPDAPGTGPLSIAEYLNLRHLDTTPTPAGRPTRSMSGMRRRRSRRGSATSH